MIMFEDFTNKCAMADGIKPNKKRTANNISAVKSLIEHEGKVPKKRRVKFKPLIVAGAALALSAGTFFTVNAAMKGAVVDFFMGKEKHEGDYIDYVDGNGYRHISFRTTLPLFEQNYMVIIDVDKQGADAVTFFTKDDNPEYFGRLEEYDKALKEHNASLPFTNEEEGIKMSDDCPQPKDFGLVFKDSEICFYSIGFLAEDDFDLGDGYLGGNFMFIGEAGKHPSGAGGDPDTELPGDWHYDWENETQQANFQLFYYVGKE